MNHDVLHCFDYCEECPKDCFRAQVTQDLTDSKYPYPVAYGMLKGTDMCPKWPSKE